MLAAIGYALLLIAITVLVTVAVLVWNMVIALPKETAAPIIAGFFTVVVSVGSLIVSKQWERRREVEQELRKQKLPVYEEFQAFWIKLLMQNKPGMTPVSEKDMTRFMAGLTPKLMLWGSDALLSRYAELTQQANLATQQPTGITKEPSIATMVAFEKLVYEMRSDLGHKAPTSVTRMNA